MSDAARADIGRVHRRTPQEFPVYVEPEVTPPPRPVPPSPDDLAKAVYRLELAQYEARHDHERLDGLVKRVGDLGRDSIETGALLTQFLVPGLKDMMGRVDGLLHKQAEVLAQQRQFFEREWPEVLRTVAEIGRDLSRTERALAKLTDAHEQLEQRVDVAVADARKANDRIAALETKNAVDTGVSHALTKKQIAGGGLAVTAGGFIAGLLSRFFT